METFILLTLTHLCSLLGSRMSAVAVGLWVYARTGQSEPLLLAAFPAETPSMAIDSLVLPARRDRANGLQETCFLLAGTVAPALTHRLLGLLLQVQIGRCGDLQPLAAKAVLTEQRLQLLARDHDQVAHAC